ncbi:tetratricopeptide repeat protein [Thiocapsa rosea]|uniref:Sel1 repeat-containing protein n=1 Tax=Thiocapsa rosea TaxID=69360 RepID=A0A495VA96_9GAMM|nr:SEL1-like repeat protein [Thiocapsa rosea]RKT46316.1 hypothetical protein BDD21_3823 [Thiocapsa rosea]
MNFVNRLKQAGLSCLAAAAVASCDSAPMGGVEMQRDTQQATGLPRDIDEYVVVDCLLPGQIRRLGTMATYLGARQSVKTTRKDCGIRGGEYVLFDRSDYATALSTLLPQAQSGDPVAQTYVGEIYEKGLGLPAPDYGRAAEWYRRAAEKNHRPAQTSLGSLYERGLGVPKDNVAALDWYRRASGITEDRLIFESTLEQERAAFRKEIALKNQVAAGLKRTAQATRDELIKQRAASRSRPAEAVDLSALQRAHDDQQRLLESQRRDAESEAQRLRRELHAIQELKAREQAEVPTGGRSGERAAQLEKLELVRTQQYDAVLDTSRRLAGPP